MHNRTIEFVRDPGPHTRDDNKTLLRDTKTEELIICAFDKHGKCRANCAALKIEGSANDIVCGRMDSIIGCVKSD